MSDFISPFWSYWVSFIAIGGMVAMFLLLFFTRQSNASENPGDSTTGHVWDIDLKEYNNPLMRWWVIKFFLLIVFALIYLYLYPGLGSNPGKLGFTAQKQLEEDSIAHQKSSQAFLSKYTSFDFPELGKHPEALAIGERLFLNNCAICHGSNAKGSYGFPNLSDIDWLYGGTPENIIQTITQGRNGVMPSFAAVLGPQEINDVTHYVRSLSGLSANPIKVASGQAIFTNNCVACHGADGRGNTTIGAPNLTDKTWLYSSNEQDIMKTVTYGRNNLMPSQAPYLTPEQIYLLAGYVWGRSNK